MTVLSRFLVAFSWLYDFHRGWLLLGFLDCLWAVARGLGAGLGY